MLSSAWIQFWPNYTLTFIFGHLIVRYVICKYFLLLCGLPLCFLDGVLCTKFFILMKSSVSDYFFLLLLALLPYSRMVIFNLPIGQLWLLQLLPPLPQVMHAFDQHVTNLRVFWSIESFLHVLSCNSSTHSGNNSLLPALQKLTGKLPESAGIRANVPKVLS